MYDVVYYTAENRKEAESLLRRLTEEEAKELNSTPLRAVVVKPSQVLPTVNPGNSTRAVGKAQMRNLWGHTAINMDSPKEFFTLEEIKPGLVVGNFLPEVFDRPSIQRQIAIEKERAKRISDCTEKYLEAEEQANDCSFVVGLTVAQWLRKICGLSKVDEDKSRRALENLALHAQGGHPIACAILETAQKIALVAAEEKKEKFDDAMLNDVELRAGMAISSIKGAHWLPSGGFGVKE